MNCEPLPNNLTSEQLNAVHQLLDDLVALVPPAELVQDRLRIGALTGLSGREIPGQRLARLTEPGAYVEDDGASVHGEIIELH